MYIYCLSNPTDPGTQGEAPQHNMYILIFISRDFSCTNHK